MKPTLGIHELGHVLFHPFGQTLGMAGGTIAQCAAPLGSFWMFIRQRDVFALAFSFVWLATNFFGIAEYVADARAMAIPLVSPFGGHVYHDWHVLLSRLGWLPYDRTLGGWVRVAGYVSLVLGVVWGAWTLWLMAVTRDTSRRLLE